MKIVIDSREKCPLHFALEYTCVVRALKTGDYTVDGYGDGVAVERKKLSEIVGCITSGRRRFLNQLKRLKKFKYRCVVVEGDMYTLMRKNYVGYIQPQEALDLMTELMVEFRIPFYFTGSAGNTAHFVLSFLKSSCKAIDREE